MQYIQHEIENIKNKPYLHLGNNNLSTMHTYLNGFTAALHLLKIENKTDMLLPLPFEFFHDFVSFRYIGQQSSAGWCRIILETNNNDEEASLKVFFQLHSDFLDLSIKNCKYSQLSEIERGYHKTHPNVPTRAVAPDFKPEPLFINPIEVYIIELTSSNCIVLVNTNTSHCLYQRLFGNESEANHFIEQCFGSSLNWVNKKLNNIKYDRELVLL
ncbi:MAG: hypothetical protein FWG88_11800 [Oscillospiraceae bacterium]|nr:hypothetical protein [Oscillospiraceae bacterium]